MTTTSSPEQIYDDSDEETNDNNEDLSSDEDGIEWTNQLAKELHKRVINDESLFQVSVGFGLVISPTSPSINDSITDTNIYFALYRYFQ